jgi:hypothetical protein
MFTLYYTTYFIGYFFILEQTKCYYQILGCLYLVIKAGIAQSVQRLATGWTIRGSNPGRGEIFRTRPDRPWGPPNLLYNKYRAFPGVSFVSVCTSRRMSPVAMAIMLDMQLFLLPHLVVNRERSK